MSMSRFKLLVVPFIVIGTLALGACATNQVDRKQATEQKARDMSGTVWATNYQVDATLVSLNNLMSAEGPQLQQAFDQYSADVDRMHKQADKVSEDSAYINKESDEYLSNWQKQNNDIQNANLRDNSEQGRQAVRDQFRNAQGSYDNARTSMDRFIRTLEDVRTALRNDLSERGIKGVARTNVVQTARKDAREVKTALRAVRNDSTALARALSPTAQPVAAATEEQ